MANFAKYTAAAAGHLMAHYERGRGENGEYVRFSNQAIDLDRTPENYNLAPHREGGQLAFLQKRLSEVKVQKRADVNVMGSWVVTLPQGEYTRQQQQDFFAAAYRFLADRYGEQNVISAYVHRDENQPHMHFSFIPIVPDTKWNAKHPDNPREKVSAKECVTKGDLDQFHKQLQTYLNRQFEADLFPVLNGATAGGNRSIAEMKADLAASIHQEVMDELTEQFNEEVRQQEEIRQKTEELREPLQKAVVSLQRSTERLEAMKSEQDRLTAQNEALRATGAALQTENAELRAEISAAKDELGVMQRALAAIQQKAAAAVGTAAAYKQVIAEARAKQAKERKLQVLEKFLQIPAVKVLWETYCKSRGIDPISAEPTKKRRGLGQER